VTIEGTGELGVEVSYCGEDSRFSMTQVLGMLLTKARQVVELNNPGVKTVEAVLTVPVYYTDAQRRAVLDAAEIARIKCLRLMNEGTAAALSFGMFKGVKKEFPEGKETPVLFLDMGASGTTATVATFTNASLRILSSVGDASLGGRDIDVAVAKHFAAEFKAKTGADAWASKKARLKLLAAAEKAKISISPHGVNSTPVSIECLFEDRDYNSTLTEETLVELVGVPVADKLGRVIAAALKQAGLSSYKDAASVELVGGSMRPRLVKRVAATALGMPLDEATGHGLSQSMNLDETVARGATLACAALSYTRAANAFSVIDAVHHAVRAAYEAAGAPAAGAGGAAAGGADDGAMDEEEGDGGAGGGGAPGGGAAQEVDVFKAGASIEGAAASKTFKFGKRSGTFEIALAYKPDADAPFMLPPGTPTELGRYTLAVPADALGPTGTCAVKVTIEHSRDGTVALTAAKAMKDVTDAEGAAAPAPGAEGGAAAAPAADGAAPAPPAVVKRKYKPVDVPVVLAAGHVGRRAAPAALAAAVDAERAMVERDNEIHATQDARNALETYIYEARSAMEEALVPYTTAAQRAAAAAALEGMEGWLYGDGFAADKATYFGKLAELKAGVEPAQKRKVEGEGRYAAVAALAEAIAAFRDVYDNKSGAHGHLDQADRDTLRSATSEADAWLKGKTEEQSKKEAHEEPAVTLAELGAWKDKLTRECTHIANKKPPPPPAAPIPMPVPEAMDVDADMPKMTKGGMN